MALSCSRFDEVSRSWRRKLNNETMLNTIIGDWYNESDLLLCQKHSLEESNKLEISRERAQHMSLAQTGKPAASSLIQCVGMRRLSDISDDDGFLHLSGNTLAWETRSDGIKVIDLPTGKAANIPFPGHQSAECVGLTSSYVLLRGFSRNEIIAFETLGLLNQVRGQGQEHIRKCLKLPSFAKDIVADNCLSVLGS